MLHAWREQAEMAARQQATAEPAFVFVNINNALL
jgi:hypothetical protein